MGKRSNFALKPRGFYPTPIEALVPLVAHLPACGVEYWEPCAGDGRLITNLRTLWPNGYCARADDILPMRYDVQRGDAVTAIAPRRATMAITNPPWPMGGRKGGPTIQIIRNLAEQLPTWLLLPWNFYANAYMADIGVPCAKIVPIGRVSWEGNGIAGKDDSSWSLWDARHTGPTVLHRRVAPVTERGPPTADR
tara:strand:+ start:153 stop:734 length:582 start_codon:yes stop_codon:yes gene_type:complete